MSEYIRVYQQSHSRPLTPAQTVAACQLAPTQLNIFGNYLGHIGWGITFYQHRSYGLVLRFRANTAHWQPPSSEEMAQWLPAILKPYLPSNWSLLPYGIPRTDEEGVYLFTCRVVTDLTSTDGDLTISPVQCSELSTASEGG